MSDAGQVIVGAAYLALLAAIASERVERHHAALATAVAVAAASVLLDFGDPVEALLGVDWDVIGLVIVASALSWFLDDSGIAGEAARMVVRHSRGSPTLFLLLASGISGFLSLFLENVSVVIILAPVVFKAARALGMNPVPVVIAVALSSNLSGSALLVGDPQAAIVASAYDLDFLDYIIYDGRPSMFFMVTAAMAAAILSLPLYVRVEGRAPGGGRADPDSIEGVKDRVYVAAALAALVGKAVLLSVRKELGLSLTEAAAPPVIALALVYWRRNPRALLRASLDPPLLTFLASVFFLVNYVDRVGLTRLAADAILRASESLAEAVAIIVIVSAIVSSIMDNVPFIAAMIPVINVISGVYLVDPVVLAWALLLGATLGGNMTYIGASANYTAVRELEKRGHRVTLAYFAAIGVPYTMVALGVGAAAYYAFYRDFLEAP